MVKGRLAKDAKGEGNGTRHQIRRWKKVMKLENGVK